MNRSNKKMVRDFAKERYLKLVQLHPRLREEKTQKYLMLSLTFISLTFLGIFAINPTLTTITGLNKKLEDSELVSTALRTKMANLSNLNNQYQSLTNVLSVVDKAVPNMPNVTSVLAQIQIIAKDTGVKMLNIQSSKVELITANPVSMKEKSFAFTVSIQGDMTNILQFIKVMTKFDRIITINSINYSNNEKQVVTISGKAFFLL